MTMTKIEDLGYVAGMRQMLGVDATDASSDAEILARSPLERVQLITEWEFGDALWANIFKGYFESQGVYLTTDPNAHGVLHEEE